MLTAKLHNSSKKMKAFTLVEILVVIAILAILAVVTFVVINPVQRINDANDNRVKEEVQSILGAVQLYIVDNSGSKPTAGGSALPTVTTANIMTAGADASTVSGISPTYITTIPTQPSGSEYKVGVLASGAVIVGGTLSDASVFTKTQ